MNLLTNKTAKNAIWIIAGKVFQSLLALVVNMLTARYLGPSNFGLISYASSIVAFVVPIMQLGFNSVLVQEFTNHPEEEGKILGTSICLSFICGIFCIIGVYGFTLVANPGELSTTIVCVIYSLMLLFQATEMVLYWFQYKLLSKYTAIVSLLAYLLVSGYKVFLLATAKDVVWFAISYSIDYFIISISLYFIYRKLGGAKFSFSWDVAKRVFSRSKFYIISGLAVVVYAQIDKIMLKIMIDDAATGLYTAAVSTAGMASFVYAAIIDSLRPTIFEHKKNEDNSGYEKKISLLYSIVIYLALFQSLVMTIFAPVIVKILYGADYEPSIVALQIIVWYTTFSYYGGAKDVWILGEGKQKFLVWLNISGAVANIGLNWLLIPYMGINGAALASLITQIFTNIIMLIIIKPLRRNQLLLLKSLNPMNIVVLFKK